MPYDPASLSINLKQFELTLREHIIGSWRELDSLTPHDSHHSSRIMRTYHTHLGKPLGIAPGWWDDRVYKGLQRGSPAATYVGLIGIAGSASVK